MRICTGAALAALIVAAGCSPPSSDSTAKQNAGGSDSQPGPQADGKCDKARALALFTRMSVLSPISGFAKVDDGPVLIVEPDGWRQLGYDRQRQVISIMNCALVGPGKFYSVIHVRADRDGADMIKAESTDLLEWQDAGMAFIPPDRQSAPHRHHHKVQVTKPSD